MEKLTERELEFFRLLAIGYREVDIAEKKGYNFGYVRNKTLIGRKKLNAKTNTQAVAMLVAEGIL